MTDDAKSAIPTRSVGQQYVNDEPLTTDQSNVPTTLEDAIAQSGADTLTKRLGQEYSDNEEAPISKNGRAVSKIELYSLEAQWAFNGLSYNPEKPRQRTRPGWEAFRSKARYIILCASTKDDPYAIRTLIELDEQFNELISRHKERVKQLEELLRINDGNSSPRPGRGLRIVEPSIARFEKQTTFIYKSLNAYARVMADQISVFDRMVILLLTSRDCGLIDKKIVNKTTKEERRAFGSIFETALRFRPSGITRADVSKGLATVKEAHEKYGPIPVGILDGTMSPKYVDITSLLESDAELEDDATMGGELVEPGSEIETTEKVGSNGGASSTAVAAAKEVS